MVAICDLIPMIGATLGAVIGITVALFSTQLWPTTLLVAAFFIGYQQLENYLIAPGSSRPRSSSGPPPSSSPASSAPPSSAWSGP